MEAANKFAVVKFVGESIVKHVPTGRIPKLTLPLNAFKQYIVVDDDGKKRPAIVLHVVDTLEEAEAKARSGRRATVPPKKLLQEASALSEDEEMCSQQSQSSLLTTTHKKVSLVQETRKNLQNDLLATLGAKIVEAQLKNQRTSKIEPATSSQSAISRQPTNQKLTSSKSTSSSSKSTSSSSKSTSSSSKPTSSSSKPTSSSSKPTSSSSKPTSSISKSVSSLPTSSQPTRSKSSVKIAESKQAVVNTPDMFTDSEVMFGDMCGPVEAFQHMEEAAEYCAQQPAAKKTKLDKNCEGVTNKNVTKETPAPPVTILEFQAALNRLQQDNQQLRRERDSLLVKSEKLQAQNDVLSELNVEYQQGVLSQMKAFFTSQSSASTSTQVSQHQASCSYGGDVDVADQEVWALVGPPGQKRKIHIGLGITLEENIHKRILFHAKTPSVYVRSLAEELFGAPKLLEHKVSELDPTTLLGMQASLREYLTRRRNLSGVALDVECEKFAGHMHSARSDLKKAAKRKDEPDESQTRKKSSSGRKSGTTAGIAPRAADEGTEPEEREEGADRNAEQHQSQPNSPFLEEAGPDVEQHHSQRNSPPSEEIAAGHDPLTAHESESADDIDEPSSQKSASCSENDDTDFSNRD